MAITERNHLLSSETPTMGVDLDRFITATNRRRVMVVDDDHDTVHILKLILLHEGYDVFGASGGNDALKKYMAWMPDLVVLDLMMPDMDGIETMRRMRQVGDTPLILLSARNTPDDVVAGLKAGADDYVTKPFHNGEILARVESLLRRAVHRHPQERLTFPDIGLEIDLVSHIAMKDGEDCYLTRQEFDLCRLLAWRADQIVTHETIAAELWGADNADIRRRTKYLVYLLRRKIEEDYRHPKLILNRGGIGYVFRSMKE